MFSPSKAEVEAQWANIARPEQEKPHDRGRGAKVEVDLGAFLAWRPDSTQPPGLPMPPIHLSDSELDAVMAAARPLAVERRDAFLQAVAGALRGCGEIGPGVVHRVCAETQRAFFDPPDLSRPGRRAG
jgi:hypothetical protein